MSTAFRCDICGACVEFAADAKANRVVASESTIIFTVPTVVGIEVQTDKEHVCDTCWAEVMRKVKIWAANKLP
jgi:hypothetical protein